MSEDWFSRAAAELDDRARRAIANGEPEVAEVFLSAATRAREAAARGLGHDLCEPVTNNDVQFAADAIARVTALLMARGAAHLSFGEAKASGFVTSDEIAHTAVGIEPPLY